MSRLRVAAAGLAVAGALAGAGTAQAAQPLNSTGIPDRYAAQQLDWHTCTGDELPTAPPPGAEGIQCATFQTPRNWNRTEDRQDITIAVSRLQATGAKATASVLTNPGGPGAPGRAFPARLRNQTKLRATQEIIGMDPRGTGKSTNITCGGAISVVGPLDPRDRSAGNIETIQDATRYAASSCQSKSGELGKLINTAQTVRDMDLLRVLLKRQTVNYVGYSAGTWLGAHYAQRFPTRAKRFVLDSNTEFTTTWQKSFDWQPLGFERRFREDFLPWLATYDALYRFGTTAEAARQEYERVRYQLQQQPADLGDGTTFGPNDLDATITGALYDKRSFQPLAETMAQIRDLVDGTQQQTLAARSLRNDTLRFGDGGPRPLVVPTDYADAYDASFWTIPCNEGPWNATEQSALRQSDRLLRQDLPLLGAGWFIQPCIYWNQAGAPLPQLTGKGVKPVLMVQSTHDPATPIEGAQRAHQAFAGSRMITVTGEGDHGIYAGGNARVDQLVEAYLVDNRIPADQSVPGVPLPVPTTAGQ